MICNWFGMIWNWFGGNRHAVEQAVQCAEHSNEAAHKANDVAESALRTHG